MTSSYFFSCAVALPLLLAGPVAGHAAHDVRALPTVSDGLPEAAYLGLPGVFSQPVGAPVLLAQVSDSRVVQLEEQVRQLNGLVEELNFQILQMQDQLRRLQEDNEFRFQELEERRSDAGAASTPRSDRVTAPPADGALSDDFAALPEDDSGTILGTPPRTFGTIVFDADGNPRVSAPEQPDSGIAGPPPDDRTVVAALPPASDADELYRNSYEFILSGDYSTAEAGFRDLIERFPGSEMEADSHFWLGEALLAQQRPREAAEVFLSASRDFPQSRKAPEILYKLGVSLVELNQRDVACATLAEVANRFPTASEALLERVRQEQALASC